ncbi:hypothetical protein CN311_08025 [Mesorhizobium sanjuanii]|uniref:Pentapeptide repeat-containing protein n=2 Tax=Mesorhizobium sanjuanii TaxID=2037900 RepID=A0A2A6FIW0_9HYPH|nr:hypothetical protein CN311_08025 [Mesorhizobium sanjuanii]
MISGLDPTSDFRFANFEGMDFSNCQLTGFDFTGCDFTNAIIGNADFNGANIKGARFPGHIRPIVVSTELLAKKRKAIVSAMSSKLKEELVQTSRALYQSTDGSKRIVCTLSKKYDSRTPYWYAYHPKWDEFLRGGNEGYFVLGCMDLDIAFSIPRLVINRLLIDLHVSKTEKSQYWHIHISQPNESEHVLVVPHKNNISLKPYEFAI